MKDNESANRIRQEIEKLVANNKALKKSKNGDAKEMAFISEANARALRLETNGEIKIIEFASEK